MNFTITPTIEKYTRALNRLRKSGYSWENREIDTTVDKIGILDEENYFMNEDETVIFFDVDSKFIYYGNVLHDLEDDDFEFDVTF